MLPRSLRVSPRGWIAVSRPGRFAITVSSLGCPALIVRVGSPGIETFGASLPLIGTSFQAVYGKLGRFNPAVSEALLRHSAQRCGQVLALLPQARSEPLAGYRMRVLDGNVLAGSEHRLTPLRQWLNACLPGKSLVVYEPGFGLVTDLVLCEDAYTQERALVRQLLPRVQANDLFVADRNFCTPRLVFGVSRKEAFILVRQHRRSLPCQALGQLKKCGQTDTGVVYEQVV